MPVGLRAPSRTQSHSLRGEEIILDYHGCQVLAALYNRQHRRLRGGTAASVRHFEYIEHTGDLGILVVGHSRAELFAHAAEGLIDALTDPGTIVERFDRTFPVEANGYESLLVSWLNELLYYFETKGWLFKRFETLELTATRVHMRAWGEAYDSERHTIKTLIKAVTYHQLEIRRAGREWQVQIVFDL
jgi:SHS2 domain-containing protein